MRMVGVVVSNKMQKSVVVAVDHYFHNKLYDWYIKRTNKFMAHDEENLCKMGDTVRIRSSRPLSRRKRWFVSDILKRAVVYDPKKVYEAPKTEFTSDTSSDRKVRLSTPD